MTTLDELKAKIEKIQALTEEKQTALAKAINAVDTTEEEEAKSVHETEVSALSAEVEALKESAQIAYNNYTRLTPLKFNFESKSVNAKEGADLSKLEEMLNNLQVKTSSTSGQKRSPGQYIADFLESQNVKSEMDFDKVFGRGMIPFFFQANDTDEAARAEINAAKSIKSLYTNNGVELVVSGTPVPGFQGYGCTIFEITDECRQCIEPYSFADFLTMRNMPTGNTIQYDYPVSRTDNASGVLETIYNPYPTKVQNGRKPEGTFTYNTAKVKVSKIAEFITASDEVLDDCSKVADRIDFFLTTSLIRERDRQLIAGLGTNGQVLGLLNQPGTLALDGDVLTTGVDVPNVWDKLYLALLELEQNCAMVDGVIINPADRAKIALAKDANGNYLFPQEGNCNVTGVGCLTIRTSPDVPAGTAIIGEFKNNWIWYARQNLVIKVGLTGDQFIENTRTFLAELRGAVVLICPQKIAIVTNI